MPKVGAKSWGWLRNSGILVFPSPVGIFQGMILVFFVFPQFLECLRTFCANCLYFCVHLPSLCTRTSTRCRCLDCYLYPLAPSLPLPLRLPRPPPRPLPHLAYASASAFTSTFTTVVLLMPLPLPMPYVACAFAPTSTSTFICSPSTSALPPTSAPTLVCLYIDLCHIYLFLFPLVLPRPLPAVAVSISFASEVGDRGKGKDTSCRSSCCISTSSPYLWVDLYPPSPPRPLSLPS